MQAPLIPIVKDQTLLTYHERFSFCHILIRSCLSNVSTTDFSKVLSCDCSNRKSEENWPKKLFLLSYISACINKAYFQNSFIFNELTELYAISN